MKNPYGMGKVGKTSGHAVGTHSGATKYDDAFVVCFFEQAEEKFVLLVGGNRVERVGNGFCGGLTQTDFNRDGLLQGPLGKPFDFGRDRGGEKESLAFFRA